MIGKLSYDEIIKMAHELKEQSDIVERLGESKESQELIDFAATVEGYTKFLENTIEINKDADNALQDLKKKLRK